MSDPVPSVQSTVVPPVVAKPLGLIRDPAGDLSSKRLESMVAMCVAIAYPFFAAMILAWLKFDMKSVIDPGVFVGALLGFSAGQQTVSAIAERGWVH